MTHVRESATPASLTRNALADRFRAYIACLNAQEWESLGHFVHPEARHNGTAFGLAGYRDMLIDDFRRIPDLRFDVGCLLSDPPKIAARLLFDCTPSGVLFGIPVHGRRVRFAENVFYRYRDGKIHDVLSVIDTAAIARQVDAP